MYSLKKTIKTKEENEKALENENIAREAYALWSSVMKYKEGLS